MNRVFWPPAFKVLSLVLIGTALVSPIRAQDRSRATRSTSSQVGLVRDVLRDAAVRSELALTDEQIDKLRQISNDADFFAKMGPIFQKVRNAETDEQRLAAREEMRAAAAALTSEVEAKARQVLDEAQFERALQIYLQREGVRALLRTDVARELGFTMAQVDQLKGAAGEYEDARMLLGPAGSEADHQKVRLEFESKMLGVLTDEQKSRWTARLGAPAPSERAIPPSRSGPGPRSSPAALDARAQSDPRRASGSQTAGGETPPPSSYGMIEDDAIAGLIQFVALTEVLPARGRTLSLSRDQLLLLTNLQTRIRLDNRLNDLRLRLPLARTFEECAAIRLESCILLEQWNAEVEQEVQMIIGDKTFAKLRPAILKRQGLWALTRPDVAAELKIASNQSDQLKAILNDYRAAAAAAPADATRQEQARLKAEFEQKMMPVLTAEQRSQWQSVTAP